MPADQAGRLLVSRRALADVVRIATLGSYGVTGLAAPLPLRLLARIGLTEPGVRVREQNGGLNVELDLVVARGLPIAEVARQVDAAVRHAVRRATDREIGSLAIHVRHLRFESAREGRPQPSSHEAQTAPAPPASPGGSAPDLPGTR